MPQIKTSRRTPVKTSPATMATPAELAEIASAVVGMMRAFKLAEAGVLRFLDVPMPNGKTMGNCTGAYGRKIGQWMQDIGREGDHTVITAGTLRAVFDERPELLTQYRDLTKTAP